MALFTGVNSLQEKSISSNEFSLGDAENYINVTESVLTIKDRGGDFFNNEANIFVYNNATYDSISFDIESSSYNGEYPLGLGIDLDNNGREEYRFSGWSVGPMGNQVNIIDDSWTSQESFEVFPSPEGDYYYIKLPSRATVNDVNVDISHPLKPVLLEGYFNEDNLDIGSSYLYKYNREYTSGSNPYRYLTTYYYGQSYYTDYDYSSQIRGLDYNSYPAYDHPYSSYSHYAIGHPDARLYMKWDTEDDDLRVPPGATIMSYELNYPISTYLYYNSYGYSWTSNTARYYSGEQYYGVYETKEDLISEDEMNRVYSGSAKYYYQQDQNKYTWDDANDTYFEFIPEIGTDLIDSYKKEEEFSNGAMNHFEPLYDLKDLAQEWVDGTKENHGICLTRYKTPYTEIYHNGSIGDYVMYNDARSYNQARDKNNYQHFYAGYLYNPLNTYYLQYGYGQYYPKLLIEYDLASKNPWVDFADDGIVEYQHVGDLGATPVTLGGTVAYTNAINNYLNSHLPDEVDDYGNEFTYVPFKVGGDSAGKIVMNNMSIKYDYTPKVFYNPNNVNFINELNSVVPSQEDGWSLIQLNMTAKSAGNVTIKNLELSGVKPNYRPEVSMINVPPVPEGIVDDEWLDLTGFFYDVDQDASTLEYWVESNSEEDHVEFFINKPMTRGDPVYLGIDTTIDENWFGEVHVVVSALDEMGKSISTDPIAVTIESVNDYPYLDMELPEISGEEGVDPILIEYTAPTGRGVATGKISFMMSADGMPYFKDIEEDDIYLGFQLLDGDMNETLLETSNEDGFKIYRGSDGEISLYVLPPEYTEDPDNFIIVIGSNSDYNLDGNKYYLRVFMSDDPEDIYGQSFETMDIMITPVNDPPIVASIPDVIFDEDSSYVGNIDFIAEYLGDIDSPSDDLAVTFEPSAEEVKVYLDSDNYLHVDADLDFNGVVPIMVKATDGVDHEIASFNVRIRSINDAPKVVVSNLFNGKIIDDMFYIRGTANDIEKDLRWIEIGVVEEGEFLYEDDWDIADGIYVWQYLMDIRNLNTGTYDVTIRAYDGIDYSPTLEFKVNVKTPEPGLPSPAPVVTITTEFTEILSDKVSIAGTAVDESGYVEFVEFRVDGGLWEKISLEGDNWMAILNTRTLTNTVHNLSVRAYDGKSYSEVDFDEFEVMNVDSDLDGITNEMENILQLDPFNPLDGTMDFDEDGYSNAEEVEANTNIFDGDSYPNKGDDGPFLDTWAIIFIALAIISAVVILALFILNIRIERNMHMWREDLHRRRAERKPKTLLQKIVEITPVFGSSAMQPAGPALPGGQNETGSESAALPPAQEQDMEQQPNM